MGKIVVSFFISIKKDNNNTCYVIQKTPYINCHNMKIGLRSVNVYTLNIIKFFL